MIMPRFRRYRVFLVFAVIATLLLVRAARSRSWADTLSDGPGDSKTVQYWEQDENARSPQQGKKLPPAKTAGSPPVAFEGVPESLQLLRPSSAVVAQVPSSGPAPAYVPATAASSGLLRDATPTAATSDSPLELGIPSRKVPSPTLQFDGGEPEQIHAEYAGSVEESTVFPSPTIRWEKQPERFPVPSESLIKLPTGRPLSIPKIQHAFSDESTSAKITRQERQAKVKEAFQFAWNGYKEKAWMHDEVKPVSGTFKDPFCGWAATLVDSLDSLWIMGLETEFAEAVEAVGHIDFTTSHRRDIPLFETTIRYLGGLLAAYDVSGGKHSILLDKAVELAEILMGAFDTPNRMPVLYYKWKPVYASQPHRASTRASLAELGSLSMEFTRLAQLTKEDKYYDAVARVTDALEEWQDRGTTIDGIFPDVIDASGCSRTDSSIIRPGSSSSIQSPLAPLDEPQGYEVPMPKTQKEPKKTNNNPIKNPDLEVVISPGEPGEPGRAQIQQITGGAHMKEKRQVDGLQTSDITTSQVGSAGALDGTASSSEAPTPTASLEWDCLPQGLHEIPSGQGSYSVGGGQDSTYEYFPKQYLLLGGLEDKYRKMYLKTVDAVREHLLFRPMVPDDRDILFSGRITTQGHDPDARVFEAEVTHLTCFVGGMVGMGAKLFDLPLDVEIAKRLTDGCVWAYESTQTGVMPEYAMAMPCESVNECKWNQTLWYYYLDPVRPKRAQMIQDYEDSLAVAARLQEEKEIAEAAAAAAKELEKDAAATDDTEPQEKHEAPAARPGTSNVETGADSVSIGNHKDAAEISTSSVGKRGVPEDENGHTVYARAPRVIQPDTAEMRIEKAKKYQEKLQRTVDELDEFSNKQGGSRAPPTTPHIPISEEAKSGKPDPHRPKTHAEFVEERLRSENIPPGFAKIDSNKYILRPEAIESVWYMYRITGDPIWQEKGWKMFEAIVAATRTNYGYSAIQAVTSKNPSKTDSMESFWLAETLKYFYLLYSTPDTISLDDWVLNTEAHPFLRPK